ncbi:MAG: D-glycerate dehydrogenase [Acidobacteriota bacterium]
MANHRCHVVATSPLPGDALEGLGKKVSLEVKRPEGAVSEAMLKEWFAEADGALTLLSDPVTADVIRSCPHLRVIANYAVGYNNVDVEFATDRDITVTHTPDVLTEATADLAWALILAAARHVVEGDRLVREGRFHGWAPDLLLGMDFKEKTIGIVGMGRIGRAVARRAAGFGMHTLYAQRHRLSASTEAALNARRVTLDELIQSADVVSLHCPLTEETRGLMDARRIAAMKPGAMLINTGRGPLVDEAALVEALKEGRLSGAGLDVYEKEPEVHPGLIGLSNVVLLPHIGSSGRETREIMARMAASDLLAVLEGKRPAHPVPEQAGDAPWSQAAKCHEC